MTRRIIIDSGGTARTIRRRFVIDSGGTARLIKRRFVIDSGGTARLTFRYGEVAITDTADVITGVPFGTAGYSVKSDGTVELLNAGFYENWVTPTSAAGADYEVRATILSGDTPSGSALSTWLSLGSTRSWTLTNNGSVSTSVQLTIEIRDTATSTVLDSVTVTIVSSPDA